MNFKKGIIFSLVVAAMYSGAVTANTGTMTMSGEVTENTCLVPSTQLNQSVNLAELDFEAVNNADENSSVGNTTFKFDVTGCPASTNSVGIRFDFATDGAGSKYMKNDGDARGIVFGITDSNNDLKDSGETITASDLDTSTGTATINAKLHAYRVGSANPVAGDIASAATVTFETN